MLLFFFANAQHNQTLWFNLLDKESGLSSNINITGVFQDSEEFTWISTFDAGLNQFDGTTLKHFRANPTDSTSLSSDKIYGNLFEDRNKNIWFCSAKSIECYQRKNNQFKHYKLEDFSGNPIEKYNGCFFLERDTFLWGQAGMDNTLFRYNIFDSKAQKIIGNTIYDIDRIPGVQQDGFLKYIFSIDGSKSFGLELFELDRKGNLVRQDNYFHNQDASLKLNVHSVIFKNENEVWLSTSQGLFFWDLKNTPIPSLIRDTIHQSIILDTSSFLINKVNEGLLTFNKVDKAIKPLDVYLTSKYDLDIGLAIKKLFLYNEGNLWMEYQKSGLIFCNTRKAKVRHLPKVNFKANNRNYNYRSILKDKSNNLWYTVYPIGLLQCNKKGNPLKYFTKKDITFSIPSEQIFEIFEDIHENIWIGTATGAARYNPSFNSFEPILDTQNRSVPYVEQFLTLSNCVLLAISYAQGIYKVEEQGGKWRMKSLPLFEDKKGYSTIYEDSLKQIYLGFDDRKIEIYKWDNDTLKYLRTLDVSGTINGFYEDKNGQTLWIASTEGLVTLNKRALDKKHFVFNQNHGLIDNSIQSMAVDKNGNFWLGTKSGLTLFNPFDTLFRYFTKSDGVVSIEFNEKSVMIQKNGSIWFGGNNGISIIDEPEKIRFSQKPAIVQITDFKINDESPLVLEDTCFATGANNISVIQYLKLPHTKNTLSFNFVAIDYSDPNATQLKYKLEPYDKDWVLLEKGKPGFSRYSNLPSGNYSLKIMGANSDGYWHPSAIKELKITIIPRLIERTWFQTLLFFIGILLIWIVYKYRIHQIQEKAILKTRAAENKMAALRAQMNPHFAFNSLQSINGFITKNDMLGAIEYVSQFSELMRMMLENSRQNRISLEQEINLLELYVEIETIRFAKPFSYQIIIDEKLDTFDVRIPALLLQPFVENAIKHGLFHKKDKGNLLISFSKENDFLKCVIQDDGVGRVESARINTQKGRKHKSLGLEIIKEQLEILRQSGFGNVHYKIIDLYSPLQIPIGTKVVIMLPL